MENRGHILSDNSVRKGVTNTGISKIMRRYLESTVKRGLRPHEVAIFKAQDKDAFKHVDEKGRFRGSKSP